MLVCLIFFVPNEKSFSFVLIIVYSSSEKKKKIATTTAIYNATTLSILSKLDWNYHAFYVFRFKTLLMAILSFNNDDNDNENDERERHNLQNKKKIHAFGLNSVRVANSSYGVNNIQSFNLYFFFIIWLQFSGLNIKFTAAFTRLLLFLFFWYTYKINQTLKHSLVMKKKICRPFGAEKRAIHLNLSFSMCREDISASIKSLDSIYEKKELYSK